MSPVWLLAPLYLVPAITPHEVVLTILACTFILGILTVAFNIVFGCLGVTMSVGLFCLPSAFRDAYGLIYLVGIPPFRPSGLFGGGK
jgi:branched-chain amino acid transport system permease protein